MYKVVYSPKAREDLIEIWEYIAQDNLSAADRYIDGFRESIQIYTYNPNIGREEPMLAKELGSSKLNARSFLYRNHRCYYYIAQNEMRVISVIDTRRGERTKEKLLKQSASQHKNKFQKEV